MHKPRLTLWQIWNMSFGFLGIQFGWGLQMANMSAIYQYLGAQPDQIAKLWLAAPLTGLIVQPIIGAMSDRTWCRLGRRRPYFLTGAILSSLALIAMPNSSAVWMAGGPALDSRRLDQHQHGTIPRLRGRQAARGTALGRIFNAESVHRARRRYCLRLALDDDELVSRHRRGSGDAHAIPITVRYSFYLGAVAFFGAVLWTVLTSQGISAGRSGGVSPDEKSDTARSRRDRGRNRHRAPRDALNDEAARASSSSPPGSGFSACGSILLPRFPITSSARRNPQSPLYQAGNEWAGLCYLTENAVTFFVAFILLACRGTA